MKCFTFFPCEVFKSIVHFILVVLNSDAKYSLEILDLYLEFMKFGIKEVDSPTQEVHISVLSS